MTNALGLAVEVIQTATRNPSAFSYEDLSSNAAGAAFGDNIFDPNGAPLSEQVASYVNGLRPTAPTVAPNFASLPEQVDLGSRANQSGNSRAPGTSSTSTRQPGIGSSGPPPAKAPSSSNGPKARKVTTSSGRTPDE